MSQNNIPRVNFFDGQNITETDLDTEQAAWHGTVARGVDFISGSGVQKQFAEQRVLFDTDSVPQSVITLIASGNFDGEPLYEKDAFNLTVFLQPSDSGTGNTLDVELSDADLVGSYITRVYLFGKTLSDEFIYEVLTFSQNETQTTTQYFTKVISIMTQDFFGNQNNVVTGTACRNVGGRLRILETRPMSVVRDPIMAKQDVMPNMDFVGFRPAVPALTLESVLESIAAVEADSVADLDINVSATSDRELPVNGSGIILGQKFRATSNNIQKISTLLAVRENTLAIPGEEFDWSGDIILEIRKLQTTVVCAVDSAPDDAIDYDPNPASLAEMSFSMAELAAKGIVLTDEPQVVDFVFTNSLLANPSVAPDIEVGQYYMFAIKRSGDISNGTIFVPEAIDKTTDSRLTVFSQNKWTDVEDSDLWFRIYTSALRVTDGSAVDGGVQIVLPKTLENAATGVDESYNAGGFGLLSTSSSSENYVIIQKANNFLLPEPHPATGNQVYTRIEDVPEISVVSYDTLKTLLDSGNKTIVLGSAKDINVANTPSILGTTEYPGLAYQNTFTIMNPSSDLLLHNLVGATLTPNVSKAYNSYRIIRAELFKDIYGDVNGDGEINVSDLLRVQTLDGYAKDLESGTVPSIDQIAAISTGTVSMAELFRADVTDNLEVNVVGDGAAINAYIDLGTAFAAGSTFNRLLLTVENIIDPNVAVPNLLLADPNLILVPFTAIQYRVDFIPQWKPENIVITDLRRFVLKTFTTISSEDIIADPPTGGVNTTFVPGDILLGGKILDLAGNDHAIDFEVGTIVIDLPEGKFAGEIDIFTNFIKEKMMFGDGTYVEIGALENNQVMVSTSIKSLVKDEPNGYEFEAADVDPDIENALAVLYVQESGVLRIRGENLRNVMTRPEVKTKIILTVYLKKSGFLNAQTSVSSSEFSGLLVSI